MAKYYGAAAHYNQKNGFHFDRRMTMFVVLGLIILTFVTAMFMLITSLNNGPRNDIATLVLRTQRLETFIAGQQKHIKSGDLAKVNSDAILLVTSDGTALSGQLKAAYGAFEYPKDIILAEADTTSAKKLENAALLNQFDQTYRELLRDKIAATTRLAQKINSENTNPAIKNALKTTILNLTTIDNQLSTLKL